MSYRNRAYSDTEGKAMVTDIFTSAIIQATARTLTVSDLIRTAETLRQSGQAGSVENLYAVWVECNPDDPLLYAVLFNYAVTLSDAGKLQTARECLERALSLQPDFMPACINLGRVLERLGHVGLAVVARLAVTCYLAVADEMNAGVWCHYFPLRHIDYILSPLRSPAKSFPAPREAQKSPHMVQVSSSSGVRLARMARASSG